MTDHQRTGSADGPDAAPDERFGSLGVEPDGLWQVRFRRHLRHAPERVWAALSDPEQQAQWVPGVTIDARPGGAVLFDFDEEGRAEGEVLAADPPRVLEHSWRWPDEPPATVRWELEPDGEGGTYLVLLHRPVRQGPAADYASGWHVMLDALHLHLDGGDVAGLRPDYERLYATYLERT
jgi:uncharacterized protein YndB with AHSA1/START domain